MIVRIACASAVAALALSPAAAWAAAVPSPATLRATLADPVEANFVEADVGAQGSLEGPFDANAYADYYRAFGTSETDIRRGLQTLKRNGFVGGYARQWYQLRSQSVMGELVMVFGSKGGATASEQASKQRYAQDTSFGSFIDSSQFGKDSFAATLTSYGYDWTVILFAKGNGLFAVSRASSSDYMTSEALAQAQRAFTVAPSSIAVSAQSSAHAGFTQYLRSIAAVGVIMLLAVATVVAVIVFVVRAPRPRPSVAVGSQPKP
jgi:hypothetical protein